MDDHDDLARMLGAQVWGEFRADAAKRGVNVDELTDAQLERALRRFARRLADRTYDRIVKPSPTDPVEV